MNLSTPVLVRHDDDVATVSINRPDRPNAFDVDTKVAVVWGVAAEVMPAAQGVAEAQRLAGKLATCPTAAYAASKRANSDAWRRSIEDALAAESAAQQALGLTADHEGAVTSFLAKERPIFFGR